MKLKCYKSLWEWNGVWTGSLERVAAAGYVGVEYIPPADPARDACFRRELDASDLEYIAQVVTVGPDHFASFEQQVRRAVDLGAVLINAHSGADRMSQTEQFRFFEQAARLEDGIDPDVAHETHRQRIFFNPWQTRAILDRFPGIRIGADFSHWSVVCETLLDPLDPDVAAAIERAIHIHGRVGDPERAQVTGVDSPVHAAAVGSHIDLWLAIARSMAERGEDCMTFTPEFGPPPYQSVDPTTGEPCDDLWEANLWMMRTFRDRLAADADVRASSHV